jgi:TatD DNase family protein
VNVRLPAIDAHAHIEPSVRPSDLAALDALVFAVTIHPREWEQALAREDALAIWGLGAHPARADSLRAFDADRFGEHLKRTLFIGEVGLDARAGRLSRQEVVLDAVLDAVGSVPRPITLHSAGASGGLLDALRRRPVAAPILHWWRGSRSETEQAIEMGCFFSVNGAEAADAKVLDLLPPDRVLTETDFPHTRRADRRASKPAAVETIERALETAWSLDRFRLRRQLWRTVGEIFERCDLLDRAPERMQDVLLTVGTR